MNLSWLHPGLLGLGALAVAIPVILHLIHRKRGPRVSFAAVRFLVDTDLPTARHVRLRDRLLLLLRVLALLALAFWVARPYQELPASASQLGDGPAAAVLIVDNSFSMLYEDPGSATRFERAVEAARALAESLKEGDRAALLSTTESAAQVDHLTASKDDLLRSLSEMRVSFHRADPSAAVRRALDLLQGVPEQDRRIYLFSDLQKSGWTPLPEAGEADRVPLIAVQVQGEKDSPNHAVLDAHLAEGLSLQNSAQEVQIRVARFGGGEGEIPVSLYDGDDLLSQGIAAPEAGAIEEKSLSYDSARELSAQGRIHLGDDALAADNNYYFVLRATPPVSVLLVDGDPRPVDFYSETYFLENALNPARHGPARVRAKTIRADAFRDTPLDDVQVLVLANVAAADLGAPGWEKVERFAEKGGGVLMGLGEKVDPDEYNRVLEKLLPARLRLTLDVSGRSFSQQAGELHASRITYLDLAHPALRLFGKSEQVDFAKASFGTYFLTEPIQGRDVATLMKFGNGAPALLEQPLGSGRVMLWTSSFDAQWGDFCIKPTFLPLIHQLVYYLGNTLRDSATVSYKVGESVPLRAPAGARQLRVELPGGKAVDLPVTAGDTDLPIPFEATGMPGIYHAWGVTGAAEKSSTGGFWFAVNLHPEESDTTAVSGEELSELLHLEIHAVDTGEGGAGDTRALFSRVRREEYWRAAASGVIVFLFLESIVSAFVARRRRKI